MDTSVPKFLLQIIAFLSKVTGFQFHQLVPQVEDLRLVKHPIPDSKDGLVCCRELEELEEGADETTAL